MFKLALKSEFDEVCEETGELSPQELLLKESLVRELRVFLKSWKFKLVGPVAGIVVERLLKKIQEHGLKEDSVAGIAANVWVRLHGHCAESSDEGQVAEDIVRALNEKRGALIRPLVELAIKIHPEVSDHVVAQVISEIWPEIKEILKIKS